MRRDAAAIDFRHSHRAQSGAPSRGWPEGQADAIAPPHATVAMVNALRRADSAVTRRFIEQYSESVARTLRRLLGTTDETEDLVQEVFIHALEGIDSLREPAALRTWLIGIAINKAKRRLYQHHRRRWVSLSKTGELPDIPTGREDLASAAFTAIQGVLASLHPEDRIALVLYRVDGSTYEEGAALMRVSSNTFKRRLLRAERHLMKLAQRSAILRLWLTQARKLD